LLQALFPELTIENVSNSDDSHVMQQALETTSEIIDIHHAGTAMRFLTAYFASKAGNEVVLTGSPRMKERPIKILVEALTHLGADIAYLESEACPPLRIKGKHLTQSKVSLNANVSSQYISALMLIAAKLENGLELTLEGKITSVPYIEMTLALLKQVGIEASFNGNVIKIVPQVSTLNPQTLVVESDWSSASYFYSIVALSAVGTNIRLSSYKKDSLQGDSVLASLYESFGVSTVFENEQIQIKKVSEAIKEPINFQLNHAPDIAQTIAVTCLGLGISCHLSGLHTLKIKETDRLLALKTEIEKLGGSVHITENSLALEVTKHINFDVSIATYNDHRMAMAFAPMALKTKLNIEDANVVSKSHPSFWDDLKNLGFKITQ
jgi:3-phosphoshikimate 1-carboxyvinyltransferase